MSRATDRQGMLYGMDEQLGAVLAVLVARTGGVLAQVGVIPAEDVRVLVALARDAVPTVGGPEDLVLSTSDGVHVLRSFPGAFVHLRAGPGPGVVVARRELASPALRHAVDGAARAAVLDPGTVPVPEVPRPRHAQPGDAEPHEARAQPRHARPQSTRIQPPQVPPARTPHDRPGPRHSGPAVDSAPAPDVRQPALAAIGPAAAHPAQGTGSLAVRALAADAAAPVTLPQRAVAATRPHLAVARPLALPAVLRQEWAGDTVTMGRLLEGLRRLN